MLCKVCNCPLTVLKTASGRKERRRICTRCMEEDTTDFQVNMLVQYAEQLAAEMPPELPAPVEKKEMAPVLRIDEYLRSRRRKAI